LAPQVPIEKVNASYKDLVERAFILKQVGQLFRGLWAIGSCENTRVSLDNQSSRDGWTVVSPAGFLDFLKVDDIYPFHSISSWSCDFLKPTCHWPCTILRKSVANHNQKIYKKACFYTILTFFSFFVVYSPLDIRLAFKEN
jgi:hypothetical protein